MRDAEDSEHRRMFVLSPKSVKRISREHTKQVTRLLTPDTEKIFGKIDSVETLMYVFLNYCRN